MAGQVISYTYDGLGRRVGRTDAAGSHRYYYGSVTNPLQLTASRSPAGALTVYYYDDYGRLFALRRGGAWHYVATDQVGTPKVVADAQGQVVKRLEYDSFGRLLSDSNPGFDLPLGFAGGLEDAATGLVHFWRRDYESASGRWTARDPLFFEGGQWTTPTPAAIRWVIGTPAGCLSSRIWSRRSKSGCKISIRSRSPKAPMKPTKPMRM